jgi:CRISPR/Cas system CSM-associated protein Csm4 (group 5 of RAMP superfamily)
VVVLAKSAKNVKRASSAPFKVSNDLIRQGMELYQKPEEEIYKLMGENLRTPEEKAAKALAWSPVDKANKWLEKHRDKLYKTLCVDNQACKWEKDTLDDLQKLLEKMSAVIGPVVSVLVPAGISAAAVGALVIFVAVLIAKWGIRKFCKCPPPK